MSKETLSTSEKEAPKIKLALEEKYEAENKKLLPEPEPLTPENIGSDTVDELPEPIFSGVKGSGSEIGRAHV